MASQPRHHGGTFFVLVAILRPLCSPCVAVRAPGRQVSHAGVETCEAGQKLELQLSSRTQAIKFRCAPTLPHLLPPLTHQSRGTECFTNSECTQSGSIPQLFSGPAEIVYENGVYTLESLTFPVAGATAFFLCSASEHPATEESAKCTVAVKIIGSAPIRKPRVLATSSKVYTELSVCTKSRYTWPAKRW